MTMTREIWKQINDVMLNSYYVSNLGRFRNKSGKIIKQHLHKSGYLYVVFCVNGKTITRKSHRLVAATFCNGYKEGLVVNHIDHNKTNNCADNLEWCTQKENTNDVLFKKHISEALLNSVRIKRKKVLMMSLDGEIIGEYSSAREAARVNKIPVQNISSCCLGRLNKCGGYKWRYI